MGEVVWTVAIIGGRATRATLDQLASVAGDDVHDEGVDGARDNIEQALSAREAVSFAGEVNYGNPEALRDFCRAQNLTYFISHAAAGGVFSSGFYFWKPGISDEREGGADDDGRPTLTLAELCSLKEAGASLAGVINALAQCDSSAVPMLELIEEGASRASGEPV